MDTSSQQPLELILARNLLSSLSTPAFLANRTNDIIFYNDAAGALLGRRFEESGTMPAEQWLNDFGPLNERGDPIPLEEQPVTIALRANRAARSSPDSLAVVAPSGLSIHRRGVPTSTAGVTRRCPTRSSSPTVLRPSGSFSSITTRSTTTTSWTRSAMPWPIEQASSGKPVDWVELAKERCEIALEAVERPAPASVD